MRKTGILIAVLIVSTLFGVTIPQCVGVGVGVNKAELHYTVLSEETVSKEIHIINTGDVRAQYELFFDIQYESMFTFSQNEFELNPGEDQKVDVNYYPSQNPGKDNLNILLSVKGKEAGSTIETGLQVPVTVTHQNPTTTAITTVHGHSFPLTPVDTEIRQAFGYLSSLQGSDGGIGGFSISCWVVMAIASSGYNPNDWMKDGNSIVDYLIQNRNQMDETKITDIAKFVLALTAAKINPRDIEGTDYVALLEEKENNNQFGEEAMFNDDFWTILALVSSGIDPNAQAIQNSAAFIKNNQNEDGGWSWHSSSSDVDNTASAILALVSAGESKDSSIINKGIDYLQTQLDSDGGFTFMGEANVASDAWTIMALVAVDRDPLDSVWVKNEISPVDHILNLQNSEGSFSWMGGQSGSAWWTAYAIPALLGKVYPISEGFTIEYTTTTDTNTATHVQIRIEDDTETVWNGWIEIPESVIIECYNSGKSYNIDGNNVLAILDKASEIGGFTYQVSDQWYPDIGFYIDSIGGHKAEGEYGWMFRINYAPAEASMDNVNIQPSDKILIFWGTQNVMPLKIDVDRYEVSVGESFTLTVKYRDDSNGEWIPLEGATLHVNDDYITDSEGEALISLNEQKVYDIYAEKWGDTSDDRFIRSDIVQIGVGVPIPEFSFNVLVLVSVILLAFVLISRKNSNKRNRIR